VCAEYEYVMVVRFWLTAQHRERDFRNHFASIECSILCPSLRWTSLTVNTVVSNVVIFILAIGACVVVLLTSLSVLLPIYLVWRVVTSDTYMTGWL